MMDQQLDFEKSPSHENTLDDSIKQSVTPTVHRVQEHSEGRSSDQIGNNDNAMMTEPCKPSSKAQTAVLLASEHLIAHTAGQLPAQHQTLDRTDEGSEMTLQPKTSYHDRRLTGQLGQAVSDFNTMKPHALAEADSVGIQTQLARINDEDVQLNTSALHLSGTDEQSIQTIKILADQAASVEHIHKQKLADGQRAPQRAKASADELNTMLEVNKLVDTSAAFRNSQLTIGTAQTLQQRNLHGHQTRSMEAMSAMEQSVFKETENAPMDPEDTMAIEENAKQIFVQLSDDECDVSGNGKAKDVKEQVESGRSKLLETHADKPFSSAMMVLGGGQECPNDLSQLKTDSVANSQMNASTLNKQIELSVAADENNSISTKKLNLNNKDNGSGSNNPGFGGSNACDHQNSKYQHDTNAKDLSDNSHQNTRSAVDKGNLEQRFTDPSEGRPNVDSQQSSAVSQYFNQIEADDDKISISKQVILENEEFYHAGSTENPVNADLLHLEPVELNQLSKPTLSQNHEIASELVQEQSKESSELHQPNSQTALEYSRSMNQIEAEQPPLGGGQAGNRSTGAAEADDNETAARSNTGSGSLRHLSQYRYLEKTPQFHGSSPVILEQAEENLSTLDGQQQQQVNQQQPNYESDTGCGGQPQATDSRGQSTGRLGRTQISVAEELKVVTLTDKAFGQESEAPLTQQHEDADESRFFRHPTRTISTNQEYLDDQYDIQNTVKILPGSEGYDPNAICSSSKDTFTLDGQDGGAVGTSNFGKTSHHDSASGTLITTGEQQVEGQNTNSQYTTPKILENRLNRGLIHRNASDRFINSNIATSQVRKSQQSISKEKATEIQKNRDALRTSSRFSKGHERQLDKLAERITNSVNMSQQSKNENRQSQHDEFEHYDDEMVSIADVIRNGIRESCSELPKQVLRAQQLRQSKQRRQKQKRPRGDSKESEQASQVYTHQTDTVEDTKSRVSTPSLNGSHEGEHFADPKDINYPVAIRKNNVIEGPVLRKRNEKQQMLNNQIKIALNRRRKTHERQKSEDTVNEDGDGPHMANTRSNDQRLKGKAGQRQPGTKKNPRVNNHKAIPSDSYNNGSKHDTAHKKRKDDSKESTGAEDDKRACQPSTLLPQKRIKPAKKPPVFKQRQSLHDSQRQSREKRLNKLSRSVAAANVAGQPRLNMLNAQYSSNNSQESRNAAGVATRAGNRHGNNLTANANVSLLQRGSRDFTNQNQNNNNGLDFNSSYIGQVQDITQQESSIMSGINKSFFESVMGDGQHDIKHSTPGYTQPVTIETTGSKDFFYESVSKPFAGISQQQITDLPIDQLYQLMSKNWNKEKMMFDQKCQRVLHETQQEAAQQSPAIQNDQIKARQQRFDMLRQRLLQNGKIGSGSRAADVHDISFKSQPAADRSLTEDQIRLNKNLKEVESVLQQSYDLTRKSAVAKPLQLGQFQFIFNKPDKKNHAFVLNQQQQQQQLHSQQQDDIVIPSSPISSAFTRPKLPQSHQSQNFFSRPQIASLTANNNQIFTGSRQKSQILTPKIVTNAGIAENSTNVLYHPSIRNSTQNNGQQIFQNLTFNITPTHLPHTKQGTFNHGAKCKSIGAFRQHKSVANNNFPGSTNIMPNVQQIEDSVRNEYSDPPKIQGGVRASTANNHKYRPPALQDAFNSSQGFGCNSGDELNTKLFSGYQTQKGLSPSSTSNNKDQQSLMQKLQYRSMRGRRIKDFLAQVKSQKISMIPTPLSNNAQNNPITAQDPQKQEPAGLHVKSQFSQQSSQPKIANGSLGRHNPVASSSSFQCAEDYGTTQNPIVLSNKLRSSGVNLHSENGSLNCMDSRNDLLSRPFIAVSKDTWLKNENYASQARDGATVADSLGSSFTAKEHSQNFNENNQHTQSGVLNSFLAQQDRRIDFGICKLYEMVRDGASLELKGSLGTKILKVQELENLMAFIKSKRLQTLTKQFQLKTHQDCYQTIQSQMDELSMGNRVDRMRREESLIDTERVYVLVCRAHKLYRARIDLIRIFDSIIQLEEMLPKLKKLVMSKLAGSSTVKHSTVATNKSTQADSQGNAPQLDSQERKELELMGAELKTCLSSLVVSIPALLKQYKFFNNSFVFQDKDYLKYLSKEANEVKGLLGVFNIRF